jgi:hypothetical protein
MHPHAKTNIHSYLLPVLTYLYISLYLSLLHPQVLKNEVELMARMAKTIDGFTQNQTRLAVIIDGLDSCEQDKVLQMLDTVRLTHTHSHRVIGYTVSL